MWRPATPFVILRRFLYASWTITPTLSMAFPYLLPNGKRDRDMFDWKKIGGFSFSRLGLSLINIFFRNREALIFAWRYNAEIGVFEFVLYQNTRGNWIAYDAPGQVIRVPVNTPVTMKLKYITRKRFRAKLYVASRPQDAFTFEITIPWRALLFTLVGLWYGGKNNSPGKYGGKAPQDMETFVIRKIY